MKPFAIASMLLLPLVLGTLGCGPSAPPVDSAATKQDPHGGHDHSHDDMGPHGGHLLQLEPGGGQVEWTHDDDAKLISVYVDSLPAEDISGVKFVVQIDEASQEYPLTQTDQVWTITSEELLTHLNMGEAAKVSLVVAVAGGAQQAVIEAHDHGHHH